MKAWREKLKKIDACGDAINWSKKFDTAEEAWNACKQLEWMLWLIQETDVPDDLLRAIAHDFGQVALEHLPKSIREDVRGLAEACEAKEVTPEQFYEEVDELRRGVNYEREWYVLGLYHAMNAVASDSRWGLEDHVRYAVLETASYRRSKKYTDLLRERVPYRVIAKLLRGTPDRQDLSEWEDRNE